MNKTPPGEDSSNEAPIQEVTEFHEDCRHYGDDYDESPPEDARVVEGEPYCRGCWEQIVETGYPGQPAHNPERHNYGISI